MKKRFFTNLNILLIIFTLICFGVFVVGCNRNDDKPQNPYAVKNNFSVTVTDCDDALEFAPEGFSPSFGMVLFTGALVNPEKYEYLARALAAQGYLVAISKLAYPQAYGNYNPNISTMLKYPKIKFFIAGHDVGGGAAVRHAMDYAAHGYNATGVILLAPTHFKTQKFENGQLVKDENGNPVWDHFSIADASIPTLLLETDDLLRTEELKAEAQQHINGNVTTLNTLKNSSSIAFSTVSASLIDDKSAIEQRSNTVSATMDFMIKTIRSLGIYKD